MVEATRLASEEMRLWSLAGAKDIAFCPPCQMRMFRFQVLQSRSSSYDCKRGVNNMLEPGCVFCVKVCFWCLS